MLEEMLVFSLFFKSFHYIFVMIFQKRKCHNINAKKLRLKGRELNSILQNIQINRSLNHKI